MSQLNFIELNHHIVEWAIERGLLRQDFALKQTVKLIEEIGETAGAILKGDVDKQKDGIGDIYVVITILSAQLGLTPVVPTGEAKAWKTPEQEILNMITSTDSNLSMLFCLEKLSKALGLDLNECVNLAYNEIKDRKGELKDGTFIKE
jgi:hypothetical protein